MKLVTNVYSHRRYSVRPTPAMHETARMSTRASQVRRVNTKTAAPTCSASAAASASRRAPCGYWLMGFEGSVLSASRSAGTWGWVGLRWAAHKQNVS